MAWLLARAILIVLVCCQAASCRRGATDCEDPSATGRCLARARALITSGAMDRDRGQLARARQMLTAILKRDARHVQANILLGRTYQTDPKRLASDGNDPGRAEKYFKAALASAPDNLEAMRGLARALGRALDRGGSRQRLGQARALYAKLLARAPNDIYGNLRHARVCLDLGLHEEARRLAFRAVKLTQAINSVYAIKQARNLLGQVYLALGKTEKATTLFKETMMRKNRYAFHPSDGYFFGCAYQGLGELYKEIGRQRATSIAAPRAGNPGAARLTPGGATGMLERSILALNRGEKSAALDHVDRAIGAGPTTRNLSVKGFILLLRGEYARAGEVFTRAREVDPGGAGPSAGMGHLAIVQKRYDTAERMFTAADRASAGAVTGGAAPPSYRPWIRRMIHLGRGWAAANRNRHREAVGHFDRILKKYPKDTISLLGKANSLSGLLRYDEAEAMLGEVLEIDPDNRHGLAELATIRFIKGKDLAAEQGFRSALAKDSQNYTCPYEGLGLLYLRQGKLAEAKRNFQRAIEINPGIEFKKYNGLAKVYIKEGRLREAEALLHRSMDNFPYDDEARDLLRQIRARGAAGPAGGGGDPASHAAAQRSEGAGGGKVIPLGPYVPIDLVLSDHTKMEFVEDNIHNVYRKGGVYQFSGRAIGLDLSGLTAEAAARLVKRHTSAAVSLKLDLDAHCAPEVIRAINGAKPRHLSVSIFSAAGMKRDVGCLSGLTAREIFLDLHDVPDEVLSGIARIKNLKELKILGRRFTNGGMKHLAGLENLRSLKLSNTRVSDAGMTFLSRMKSLTALNLWGTEVSDEGIAVLARMPELRELELGNTRIVGHGLRHLKGARHLRTLGLGSTDLGDAGLENVSALLGLEVIELWHTRITDEGLRALSRLKRLEHLKLFYTGISDRGLRHLRGNTGLRRLDLGATKVTDAGLRHLKQLKELEGLKLWSTNITDAGLAHLAHLSSLNELNLADTDITGPGLVHLARLPSLGWLSLWGTRVNDEGMKHLARIKTLREIEIFHTGITSAGLKHLAKLRRLRFMELSETLISDEGLRHLVTLPDLAELDLSNTRITDRGMAQIAKIKRLTELSLGSTDITDRGLKHLPVSGKLRDIELGATRITDAGLAHLGKIRRLQDLELGMTRISDAGLVKLRGLRDLHKLGLGGTSISDVGLAHLKKLENITFLALWYTKVSDHGLRHLASLQNLQELELAGTGITDRAVEHLKKLRSLRSLEIGDTRMTQKGIDQLKRHFPSLIISDLATF